MAKVFKTSAALQQGLEAACTKAIENSCNRLLGKLQELIDTEYYDVFTPNFYIRTYQFWRSATTKMLTKNCGEIFMDASAMDYNGYWTGEIQLQNAAVGSHGGYMTDTTKEHRFWEAFIAYCEENAIAILREELSKQGLKTI